MKNRVAKDLCNLTYIESLKLKNKLKDSIKNPLTAIKTIMAILFPFIFIFFSYFTRKSKKKLPNINTNFNTNIIGAIAIVILILMFLYSINKSTKEYKTHQFTTGDMHYLFPSPISSRTIYIWTILRYSFICFFQFLGVFIIYWVIGSQFLKFNASKVIYFITAMYLVLLVTSAIGGLVYFLSIKFKIGNKIRIVVKFCIAFLTGYLAISQIGSKNILQSLISTLNGKVFSSIPIIGWIKDMMIAPIVNVGTPNIQTICLIIVTLAITLASYYFADDYYEEAGGYIEEFNKNRQKLKNSDDILDISKKKVKNKRINVKVKENYKGAFAFVWKALVLKKRKVGTNVQLICCLVALLIPIVSGVFCKSSKDVLTVYSMVLIGQVFVFTANISPIKSEVKKQYIYILPGKPIEKIIAMHVVDVLNRAVFNSCLLFPAIIFTKLSLLTVILMWILINIIGILIYLSLFVITIFMPIDDDGKNAWIVSILLYVFLLPPILLGVLIGQYFKIMNLGMVIFSIVAIIEILSMFALSDKLFERLELR